MKSRPYFHFWIFTIALAILLVVPQLVQDGMFMDGLLYTCVAKNLANGMGTFWFPHFSLTELPDFHEQPPLMFGILAVLFRIFGNSLYVERLYSLFTGIVAAWLIVSTWKELFRGKELSKMAWLPVLLWIMIPVCFWAYANNMEENSMCMFTMAAMYFILRGLNSRDKIYIHLCIAGLFLFLASFTKGFPGLFPVTAIFFYWIFNRDITFRQMIGWSLLVLGIPVLIYAGLALDADIRESFRRYLFNRVFNSIQHVSNQSSRLYILGKLFMELLPSLALTLSVLAALRLRQTGHAIRQNRGKALWFFCLALAGSLPLMVTREQRGFYLVTSFPFYAIALAMLCADGLQRLLLSIQENARGLKVFRAISLLLLVFAAGFSLFKIGKTKRDREMLHDVYVIGNVVPESSIIGIPESFYQDWSLREYFIRHYGISLDIDGKTHEYVLLARNSPSPAGYAKIELGTEIYDLYKKSGNY